MSTGDPFSTFKKLDISLFVLLMLIYLSENPKWGWGWIGWSDQYWLCERENANYIKGEDILLKALAVTDLECLVHNRSVANCNQKV